MTWHATPKLDVVVGEQFIAVTREDWMFVEDLLTTDYSATDTIFGTGVSSGVQLIHTGQRGRFYGAVSNGEDVRENGFAGNIAQGQWALTGRYERQLGTPDWSLWDDIIGRMGMRRGFLVGGGAGVIPGQGATLKDAFYGTLDVSYRCDRWSALVYGAARQGRGSNGRWWTNFAALAQVGWYATPILQLYGRYEAIDPGSQPGNFRTWHSLTLGCAYRPFRWTNRAHLALEFGRLFTPIEQTIVTPSRFIGFDAPTGEQEYLRLELMLGL